MARALSSVHNRQEGLLSTMTAAFTHLEEVAEMGMQSAL